MGTVHDVATKSTARVTHAVRLSNLCPSAEQTGLGLHASSRKINPPTYAPTRQRSNLDRKDHDLAYPRVMRPVQLGYSGIYGNSVRSASP